MKDAIIAELNNVTEGDASFIKELSAAFVTNFEEFQSSIVEAANNRDANSFRAIVHKVKPSFLTIALTNEFDKLDQFGSELEKKTDAEIEIFTSWAKDFSAKVLTILHEMT